MGLGLSSIVNTLAGLDPRTLAEAAEEEERRRLAAQTAAAAGQAQQAGAAYQQAAGTPPAESGLAEFFPALLANIASVIGQDPSYRQQGEQRAAQSRAESLKVRADNLQSLRDIWGQKAEAAQKAGDLEAEEKARSKREQISRVWETVKLNAEHAGKLEEREAATAGALELEDRRQGGDIATVRAQGEEARKTQAAAGGRMDREARRALTQQGIDPDSPPGQERILSTWAHREIGRRNQLAKRGDTKSRNQAVTEVMEIQFRQWSSDTTPMAMGRRLLNARSPLYGPSAKEQRYLLTDEKVFRKVRGQWVKDAANEKRAQQAADDLVEPYFPS